VGLPVVHQSSSSRHGKLLFPPLIFFLFVIVSAYVFSIPIIIACIVLFFIHRAHIKRLRREIKNDKDFDMDAGVGVGEIPLPMDGHEGNHGFDSAEKDDMFRSGTPSSMMRDLREPVGPLPYLVPKATVSRESLHSLSDPRDNPYGAIYTSAPPSPGPGGASPFSDQASISGLSNRHLLPPGDDPPFSPSIKPPPRVPSPLAFSHPLPTSIQSDQEEGTARYNSPASRLDDKHADLPLELPNAPPLASVREHQSPATKSVFHEHLPPTKEADLPSLTNSEASEPPVQSPRETQSKQPDFSPTVRLTPGEFEQNEVVTVPDTKSLDRFEQVGTLRDEAQRGTNDSQRSPVISDTEHPAETPHRYHGNEFWDNEPDEDRAKRIQSVYREYWNDSQYYDGSEEWESLPQSSTYHAVHQPQPMRATDFQHNRSAWRDSAQNYYEGSVWRDSAQDYYEQHDWQNGQDHAHLHREKHSQSFDEGSIGLGIRSNHAPHPSHYSRPSLSYSTSSIAARSQTPQLTEPLTELPGARYKLNEMASPIAYSKPKRFVGAAGRETPVARSASPVQVLSSSWSTLPELPVPHRLRRSGSFSSIEFAPTRKYAGSEVDIGDTASVRSFARTEASLMAVSAGAGRVNRLPQDIVPLGKAGMLASLRPQNYSDVRYG
jgi:hypothetical protein